MTVARSVADVVTEHLRFELECIDRMDCNVYVPRLQYGGGVLSFLRNHLHMQVASTEPLGKISTGFAGAVHRFAQERAIPWVDFAKGQRKDDVMHEHLAHFQASEGVVFIGRAQEKTNVFRTEKRCNKDGSRYPWVTKTTAVVNHFYSYCLDEDFGPFCARTTWA